MKVFMSILLLLPAFTLCAQNNKKEKPSYYVFNDKGEPCKSEDARYMGILEKLTDSPINGSIIISMAL